MARQQVLAPVVLEVPPDGVDVVRAVLGVVVLDEERRPAHGVIVAPARFVRPGPRERHVVEAGRLDAVPLDSRDLVAPAAQIVANQRTKGRLLRDVELSIPDALRDAVETGSTFIPAQDVRWRVRIGDGDGRAWRCERCEQRPTERLLAIDGSSTVPRSGRDRGRIRPQERWPAAHEAVADECLPDGDVVAADAPGPRTAGSRITEEGEPIACRVATVPIAHAARSFERPEDRLEVDDRLDLTVAPRAQCRREDGLGIRALSPGHLPEAEASAVARPVVPRKSFRIIEREHRSRALALVEAIDPGHHRATDRPSHRSGFYRVRAASSRSRMRRVAPSTGIRSWAIESRSRTVTAPSSSESTSTVTHHGVPISSCRR